MRQVIVHVPRGQGDRVLDIAREHEGRNMVVIQGERKGQEKDVVILHLSNGRIGGMLDKLGDLSEVNVTLNPSPVLPLDNLSGDVSRQVHDVQLRSPVEVVLSSLRSIGSWKGFLGYAVAAGAVAWLGLYSNTIFLLTASMLIAPFAQPAMNAAIATATGESRLFLYSLGRYAASISLTIAIAFVLTLLIGPETETELMSQIGSVTSVALLLPLIAGFAGAVTLLQTEGDNLVSGAGIGILVAASLTPPASLAGMAAALGHWNTVMTGVFQVLLQLTGINVAASIVFMAFGVTPHQSRYTQGRRSRLGIVLTAVALVLAGLLLWQQSASPTLEGKSAAMQARTTVIKSMRERDDAILVDARTSYMETALRGGRAILVQARVLPEIAPANDEAYRQEIADYLRGRLDSEKLGAPVLMEVTLVSGPPKARP